MKFQKSLMSAALLGAMTFPALAASNTLFIPKEAPAPVIVQFIKALPAAQADLADPRVKQREGFGNMRPEVLGHVQQLERSMGFRAKHGFSHAVKGFSADLTPTQIAKLKSNPLVQLVEPDVKVQAVAQSLPYGIANSGATKSTAAMAGDGLANGADLSKTAVFVVDTGVALHPDLNVGAQVNYVGDGIEGDCHGHGTHVAGTIGAKDDSSYVVGMAPGVKILPLKVLDCTGAGSSSALIKAFDFAASTAQSNPGIKYVLNASVGFPQGTTVSTLDTAVTNAATAGVLSAIAAGNSGVDGCTTTMVKLSSGTGATGVMAVGAVDSMGTEASFSNYGACLAIWAPGVSVLSTSNTLGTAGMSGTSMATPHVAGAAALVRATDPTLTPAQVDAKLKSLARQTGTFSKNGRAITHLDVAQVSANTTPITPSLGSVVQASPSTLDFGIAKLKTGYVIRSLTVQNAGDAPLSITGFATLPAAVSVAANRCVNVAAGQSCVVDFRMTTARRVQFSTTVSTLGATKNGSFLLKGSVQ